MHKCPIIGCKLDFLSKYSLSNHLQKNKDRKHNEYYSKKKLIKKEKKCVDCNEQIIKGRLCQNCRDLRYNKNLKLILIYRKCRNCEKEFYGMFKKFATNFLCNECSNKSKNEKKIKLKNYYKEKRNKTKEKRENKKKEMFNFALKKVKNDLILNELSIFTISKMYNLNPKIVKKVGIFILGQKGYNERLKLFENNFKSLEAIEKRKEAWAKKTPDEIAKIFNRRPNNLEYLLTNQIKDKFKNVIIEHNIWRSVKENQKVKHIEIDISAKINNFKILIFCDGEAFHGKNSYFNGNTIKSDEFKSKAINKLYPYVLRYSESEIKNKFAIKDFCNIVNNIKTTKINNYYRTWMN